MISNAIFFIAVQNVAQNCLCVLKENSLCPGNANTTNLVSLFFQV